MPVTAGMIIIHAGLHSVDDVAGTGREAFSRVALTIVFALSSSLIFSLTIIPVLCSYFLKSQAHHTPYIVAKLEQAYSKVLNASLAHPKRVYALAGGALVVAALIFPLIGKSFMPTMDEGDTILQLEKMPSISLQNSIALDLDIQRKSETKFQKWPALWQEQARMNWAWTPWA